MPLPNVETPGNTAYAGGTPQPQPSNYPATQKAGNMKLVNMALTPEEAKKEYGSCMLSTDSEDEQAAERPKYPYGLCVSLCDEELSKLGITELPKVGEVLMLSAQVEVIGTEQSQNQGGAESRLRLQITDMGMGGMAPAKSAAQNLYGNSDMA